MMTIADIFDALTASDRPYKKAVPLERRSTSSASRSRTASATRSCSASSSRPRSGSVSSRPELSTSRPRAARVTPSTVRSLRDALGRGDAARAGAAERAMALSLTDDAELLRAQPGVRATKITPPTCCRSSRRRRCSATSSSRSRPRRARRRRRAIRCRPSCCIWRCTAWRTSWATITRPRREERVMFGYEAKLRARASSAAARVQRDHAGLAGAGRAPASSGELAVVQRRRRSGSSAAEVERARARGHRVDGEAWPARLPSRAAGATAACVRQRARRCAPRPR